jgi:orotidine-5'-phosphate decarboxylase
VKSIADLKPRFLTVHASGGFEMINQASLVSPEIGITGVTILTSLDEKDLKEIGYASSPLDSAIGLAQLAQRAGAKAIVSSPLEVSAIRQAVGNELTLITPGVRPASSSSGDDQKRVMNPHDAIKAGANYLVIGRPISAEFTKSVNAARDAAAIINAEINSALK